MPNSIQSIANHRPPACDTTAPPTLKVLAEYGDLHDPSRPGTAIGPLVVHFEHVEPGTVIEFLNRSARPDASWQNESHRQAFPVGDNSQSLPNGKVAVLLDNEAATNVGIHPGDVLEFRQVDAAGNASGPHLVKLDQQGGGDGRPDLQWWRIPSADRFERGGLNILPSREYHLHRDADNRAPVVLPGRMTWSRGSSVDTRSLVGERAVEPDAVVRLQNQRSGQRFEARTDDEGRFDLPFQAECGDPLQVAVHDRHGLSTDLGVMNIGFEGPHPH